MKGLRASALVETRALLASAVLTFEVDGKPVDMVKALGSLNKWDDLSAAIQSGCKLLSHVPDVVIGLPGVEHVDLSTEKLDALHKELQTNKQLFTRTIVAVSHCLFAIAKVIRVHPKTCGVPKGLQDAILAWVARFQQRAQDVEPSGSGSRYCPYAPTSATRIQDLKFFLISVYRFFGTDAARLNHVTVPTLQPCNPEAVMPGTWEETKTCLDLQTLCPGQEGWVRAEAVSWDVYKEKMGNLALDPPS
ncbi:hypothetical protein GNI_176760 [Gregarina niphandrodes]|uniref:Uncharacterized protein n=1 Tax=Gregarina niphandrodes TaxID=110365 RepID=A0A023AX82_GRENI|nr:hypothetical protein GNI_176760 [Gregarina niphandrodes]EZG43319.1 hypothetical protein GNI_176760 [Gregarina niphandrodes]|eukprot:XP_011133417.1 hypothetical protein GNI_176760 [Gregarina niphandrodes]